MAADWLIYLFTHLSWWKRIKKKEGEEDEGRKGKEKKERGEERRKKRKFSSEHPKLPLLTPLYLGF